MLKSISKKLKKNRTNLELIIIHILSVYVQIRIAALNDSSSEVDGDDFRAKTVGTREAEVCINIQIKKVIGFDELADKLFTPLYQFHFQESEAYTLYNKALGLQRQDIQKAEEAFEQLLSHGFIREVFYCCDGQTGSIPTPDNSVGRAPH